MRNNRPDFVLAASGSQAFGLTLESNGGPDENGRFTAAVCQLDAIIPRPFYDVVLRPGCADAYLQQRGLPTILYAHDMAGAVIGTCESFAEINGNFVAEGTLLIEPERRVNLAYETWIAMTARNGDGRAPLREFSIGFDVSEARWEEQEDREVLAFYVIELFEFSPVVVGASPGTGFLSAPPADELLTRFPKPGGTRTRQHSASVRREIGMARASVL